ncbi:MAG TPA: glycosyltransferase family 1 protein [Candidatus Doudnabacteria bacterium]|nr:glycosyltransferase family 1 protein [Candidatus Doudnabacteria bacterium]
MVIGIEAERANHGQKTGVEHYAKQLILHLAQIDSQNEYILYLRTKPEDWFLSLPKNFSLKVIPFPIFWTQLRLSWEMLWHPPDVLFVPASTLPLIHPKSVYTEHDVAWIYYPEIFTFYMRWFHRVFSWLARTGATKIIAISEATKQDLVKYYKVVSDKIRVVPHGYEVTSNSENELSKEVAQKLPEKYILFLSTIQPRKNLVGLIEAFAELKQEHPELPHKLVVVGKAGWKYEESFQAMKAHEDIVVYLGRVKDNERWSIYSKADLFINASFYEGFGMWILEAFECEVPVAVSNISSLPEVGGDAAVYFDPKSKAEIKQAILKVLTNEQLQQELITKGRVRLKDFSWEKCARETLEVLVSTARNTASSPLPHKERNGG